MKTIRISARLCPGFGTAVPRLAKACATLLVLAAAFAARAQLVNDGATATLNGVRTNIILGNSGAFNSLLVTNAGLFRTDLLSLTNGTKSLLAFNGGTLQTSATHNDNGLPFVVGNGVSPAAFELLGAGLHSFTGGLLITNQARLAGNGRIVGHVTNAGAGSALGVKRPAGRLVGAPALATPSATPPSLFHLYQRL